MFLLLLKNSTQVAILKYLVWKVSPDCILILQWLTVRDLMQLCSNFSLGKTYGWYLVWPQAQSCQWSWSDIWSWHGGPQPTKLGWWRAAAWEKGAWPSQPHGGDRAWLCRGEGGWSSPSPASWRERALHRPHLAMLGEGDVAQLQPTMLGLGVWELGHGEVWQW